MMDYWDSYYDAQRGMRALSSPPSQFAAFCLSEILQLGIGQVIEIGAGNGRDSIFFASHGIDVTATDESASAISLLNELNAFPLLLNAKRLDAVNEPLPLPRQPKQACAYYARFFIHTLSNDELYRFFQNLWISVNEADFVFLEYRTNLDEARPKVTPPHFRNFLQMGFVGSMAQQVGFDCVYGVEGRGMAKWKLDDAIVARQIFRRPV